MFANASFEEWNTCRPDHESNMLKNLPKMLPEIPKISPIMLLSVPIMLALCPLSCQKFLK